MKFNRIALPSGGLLLALHFPGSTDFFAFAPPLGVQAGYSIKTAGNLHIISAFACSHTWRRFAARSLGFLPLTGSFVPLGSRCVQGFWLQHVKELPPPLSLCNYTTI